PSAKVRAAILNAEDGPIYLGPYSEIMEGAVVRGAHAIGAKSRVNIGAKLRGDTTIGPSCKIGGEVANSVIQGYSNKGHEGYLGNSVLGSWCNLGADTNTSNLKNNYAPVRIWHYPSERFRNTGTQFCGLIMGDHSKCGINTMFNTGTVVGVSANIFGAGYPRNFIPSFSWGGAKGMITYRMNKVLETAALVMPRKGGELDEAEKRILAHIFEETANFRVWDKKSVPNS
ncbi:MAG: glucose-1-phosphate thymidylyltransferase, partial [Bacteroidota bacterium]